MSILSPMFYNTVCLDAEVEEVLYYVILFDGLRHMLIPFDT